MGSSMTVRKESIISLYSKNTPFGLRGEEGRVKENKVKLIENRVIFCQIYYTLLLFLQTDIFSIIDLILPSKSINLDILDVDKPRMY